MGYTGMEKGAETKTIEIVKAMIKENISLNIIIKCTGIALEEINTIKKELDVKN